ILLWIRILITTCDKYSEDVDLALDREFLGFKGDISRTQVGKLKDASNKYISNDFYNALQAEFQNAGITDVKLQIVDRKDPDDDPVKIEIIYPAIVEYTEYIQPRVLIEIGSRSLREPFTVCSFRSIIGDEFPNQPFADSFIEIACVNPERTFLEKLFLLHEEHQRPLEKMKIERKSRHLYDIEKISKTEFAAKAIEDKDLYKSIVAHRERFTKIGGVNYLTHFPPTLNPIPPIETIALWEKDYKEMQEQMIKEDSLPFEKLIAEIQSTVNQINKIEF
ncbi:MAG: nucleotidyl transferase AbiEii/AbiGii toxin family protein, partial [Paludibacter sp.]